MEAPDAVGRKIMWTFWLAQSAESPWMEDSSCTVLALPQRARAWLTELAIG